MIFLHIHRHKWVIKELKYPIWHTHERVLPMDLIGGYITEDVLNLGTAVFYECRCGKTKVETCTGKLELWHGALIELPTTNSVVEKGEA